MSFIELADTMFRGELQAATGQVKFHLSAGAIDAVDTVHIAGGAVSYSQFFNFSKTAEKDKEFFSLNANIQDEEAFLEVVVYSNLLKDLYVDGAKQNRHNAIINLEALPVIVVVPLSFGVHVVSLTASDKGTASGCINLRYIRATGSD